MPSTYAHFRLGRELLPLLSGPLRAAADAYPQLYDIGLHGPDILFNHCPLVKTRINRMGYTIHARPGSEFFSLSLEAVRRGGQPALAYAAGYLCHFAMDTVCHAYVERTELQGAVSHCAMEADLDRALMAEDGQDPLRFPLCGHIRASRENAAVIAAFYSGVTGGQIRRSVRSMVLNQRFLQSPSPLFRRMIRRVLRPFGQMADMVLSDQADPRCVRTTRRLVRQYPFCLKTALRLTEEYTAALCEGRGLGPLFSRNFNGSHCDRKEDR